jgi:hypothetical protein
MWVAFTSNLLQNKKGYVRPAEKNARLVVTTAVAINITATARYHRLACNKFTTFWINFLLPALGQKKEMLP